MDSNKLIPVLIIALIFLFVYGRARTLDNESFNKNLSLDILDTSTNPIVYPVQEKMLKDITGILKRFGVVHWIDGPTLASAVAYKNIPAWNSYSANICVLFDQKQKFLSLINYFKYSGYNFTKFWGGYRIYPLNGINPKYYNRVWAPWETNFDLATSSSLDEEFPDYKYPYLNIFLCRREIDNGLAVYRYSNLTARRIFSNYFYEVKDLFPLKVYRLGGAKLYGPNNPYPYILRNYPNFSKLAYSSGYRVNNPRKDRWDPMIANKVVKDRDYN